MPITPFHATAFLFLYFKDKQRVDPLALIISTTFIDLEPLYYIIQGEPLDHRVWHGFTLALTIYPILVTFAVYLMDAFLKIGCGPFTTGRGLTRSRLGIRCGTYIC